MMISLNATLRKQTVTRIGCPSLRLPYITKALQPLAHTLPNTARMLPGPALHLKSRLLPRSVDHRPSPGCHQLRFYGGWGFLPRLLPRDRTRPQPSPARSRVPGPAQPPSAAAWDRIDLPRHHTHHPCARPRTAPTRTRRPAPHPLSHTSTATAPLRRALLHTLSQAHTLSPATHRRPRMALPSYPAVATAPPSRPHCPAPARCARQPRARQCWPADACLPSFDFRANRMRRGKKSIP